MRARSLLIFLVIVLSLIPLYYFNRYLQRIIRPRESAARFFLFLLANFVLIVVYTILLVGVILRIFPPH